MKIAIVDYPDVLKSAVYGLQEMFLMANEIATEQGLTIQLQADIIGFIKRTNSQEETIPPIKDALQGNDVRYEAVILPPSMPSKFYLQPTPDLLNWLQNRHGEGSILCSACAGAFIIASTGLLAKREATTHWGLANDFTDLHPDTRLNLKEIVKNDGDIITAGGMMSWLDLGLELVAQFMSPAVMRQLGKILVIDTGQREQRFYQQFSPRLNHGDDVILNIQQTLQRDYPNTIRITELASASCLTERTFLRRFSKATGFKPSEYLQRLRIQKACDLLENTHKTFELIANEVGYEDVSACRKTFTRIIGLSPRAFKKRFVRRS